MSSFTQKSLTALTPTDNANELLRRYEERERLLAEAGWVDSVRVLPLDKQRIEDKINDVMRGV